MNVILFGFKGCGKTHFGKLLAKELNRPFIDTDQILETQEGLNCRAIYQKVGEKGFRALEAEAISSLEGTQNSVIAVGGGAILDSRNLELLQNLGRLIYLEASLETIKARGVTHAAGPIDALYHERLPLYRAISAPCIHTDLAADVVTLLMEETHAV